MFRNSFQYEDPYNYRPLQRSDLMNLSKINQKDIGYPQYQTEHPRNFSLKTDDIKGGQAKGAYPYMNKESFINKNEDIQGSKSKLLVRKEQQRENRLLQTNDIHGAAPKINKFETKRQPCNPLEPKYNLPNVQIQQQDPPKFIRDTLNINDIDGARPKKDESFIPRKNPIIYDEIEGSKPKKLFIPKGSPDSLNVKDINQSTTWKSTRVSDPFNPRYLMRDENNKLINYGEVHNSQPKQLHPTVSKSQNFSLKTQDIRGAQADTLQPLYIKNDQRRQVKVSNNASDILGAQANTKQRGMQSTRNINPLMPQYNFPGHSEKIEQYQNTRYSHNRQQSQQQSHQSQRSSQYSFGGGNSINNNNSLLQNTASQNLLSQKIQQQ